MMSSFLMLQSHIPSHHIVKKGEIKGIGPYGREGMWAPVNYIDVLLVLVRTLSHGAWILPPVSS